jgi:hypothetical protein
MKMRTDIRLSMLALGFLILCVCGTGGAAADSQTEQQWRAACTRDAFAHCPFQSLTGNRASVRDCMVRNLDKVSDACRTVINAARAQNAQPTAR